MTAAADPAPGRRRRTPKRYEAPDLADLDLEKCLLELAVQSCRAWSGALEVGVTPATFYSPRNGEIWRAVDELRGAGADERIPQLELARASGLELGDLLERIPFTLAYDPPSSGRAFAVQLRGLELLRRREEARARALEEPGPAAYGLEAAALFDLAAFTRPGEPGETWRPPAPAPDLAAVVPLDAGDDEHTAAALLPGTFRVPTFSGHWRAGRGKLFRAYRTAESWAVEAVAAMPDVRVRFTYRDHAGAPAETAYLLAFPAGEVLIRDADLREPASWQCAPVAVPPDPRILTVLAAAIREAGGEATQADASPRWEGGRLMLPPDGYGPPGYGATCGDERDARRTWQRIGALACESPRVALVLGGALGGPAAVPLGRDAFVIHLVGDARQGKTTSQRVAAAALGDPRQVLGSWDLTAVGLSRRLGELAVLPAVLDELGAANLTPSTLEALVFRVSNGNGRLTGKRTGGINVGAPWRSVLISSGNRGLATVTTNPGLAARVVEIPTPIVASADEARELSSLALTAHGWPFRWTVAASSADGATAALGGLRDAIVRADRELAADRGGPLGSIASHLALCVAGAELLAGVLELPGLGLSAMAAAREILGDVTSELAERGSLAEALLEAVSEDVVRRPAAYPGTQEEPRVPEIAGFVLSDDRIAVLSGALARIVAAAGIADPSPALRELARDGRLERGGESDGRLTRRLRTRSGSARVYVLARAGNTGNTGGEPGPGPAGPPPAPEGPPELEAHREQVLTCEEEAPVPGVPGVPGVSEIKPPTRDRAPEGRGWDALVAAVGALPPASRALARIVAAGWLERTDLDEAEQAQVWAWLEEDPGDPGPRARQRAKRAPSVFYATTAVGTFGNVNGAFLYGPADVLTLGPAPDLGTIAQAARDAVPAGAGREILVFVHESAHKPLGLPERPPGRDWSKGAPYAAAALAVNRGVPCRSWGSEGGVTVDGERRVHLHFPAWSGVLEGASTPAELLEAAELYREAIGLSLAFSPASTVHQLVRSSTACRGLEAEDPPELEPVFPVTSYAAQYTWRATPATSTKRYGRRRLAAGPLVRLFDRRSSYLSVWNADLPIGPWREEGRLVWSAGDKLAPGYYLLEERFVADLLDALERLAWPDPLARRGAWWVTQPLAVYVAELAARAAAELGTQSARAKLGAAAASRVVLAGGTKRYLSRAYDVQRKALSSLDEHGAAGELARAAVKAGYVTATGWFAFDGLRGSPLFRPAWRHVITDRHVANTCRRLLEASPLALGDVDTAAFYVSSPEEVPPGLGCGPELGAWKPKGRAVPAAAALEALDAGGMRALERLSEEVTVCGS